MGRCPVRARIEPAQVLGDAGRIAQTLRNLVDNAVRHTTGAVIVSTPQDVALLDARRGVRMFERTKVPVLGLVENMSYFCCPNCGHRTEIFGHGGARAEAARLGAAFLGEIPLLLEIRTGSDAGTPVAAAAPDSPAGQAFAAVAAAVRARLDGAAPSGGPKIVIA